MITPLLVAVALLSTSTDGEVVAPTGPIRVLVVDIRADEAAGEVAPSVTGALLAGLRARTDAPLDVLALDALPPEVSSAVVDEARACDRGACMENLALAADVDAIVFGRVTGAGPLALEVRVFSRDPGRVTAKGDVDAPDAAALLTSAEALAGQIELPKREVPVVEPPKPREIFAEPLFVSGASIAFLGAMVALASAAYAVQSELFLGDPDMHRDIKSDALQYGPLSVVVAVAGVATSVVGVGVMGLAFLLPPSE